MHGVWEVFADPQATSTQKASVRPLDPKGESIVVHLSGCDATSSNSCFSVRTFLRALAQELTDKRRRSATINWQNRASSRDKMVAMVKVLPAKYRYPPDRQPEAREKLITQAERLADTWALEAA